MKEYLNNIINENCMMTLSETNRELRRRLPGKPVVHERTVGRTLDGLLVRVKLSRPLPAERNRPDVIEKRYEYGNWFMTTGILKHCIFVDECGYNIWTSRSHGRARIGERAYRQVCSQRGRNVTIVMAVSPTNGLSSSFSTCGGNEWAVF